MEISTHITYLLFIILPSHICTLIWANLLPLLRRCLGVVYSHDDGLINFISSSPSSLVKDSRRIGIAPKCAHAKLYTHVFINFSEGWERPQDVLRELCCAVHCSANYFEGSSVQLMLYTLEVSKDFSCWSDLLCSKSVGTSSQVHVLPWSLLFACWTKGNLFLGCISDEKDFWTFPPIFEIKLHIWKSTNN